MCHSTAAHETRLFVTDKLAEVQAEISVFNAALLNGGQFYVRSLFLREVEELQKMDDNALKEAIGAIMVRHDSLSRELDQPTLAIDECHLPLHEAIGMLFHSDYKRWKPEDVLGWQRHELSRSKATAWPDWANRKRTPRGYGGYAGPTTLFSGFRWILEQYLQGPGDVRQTAIFASTAFSAWEPLMDTSKYSREKPVIERVYVQRMLSRKELLHVIETEEARSIDDEDERRAVSSKLSTWCGRPGFFFDRFLPRFREQSCGTLLDRIEKAHEAAEALLTENTFTDALNTLEGRKSFKLDPASVAVTGSEITHFLYYCYRLRGGNIECCSSDMARLVEAGLAIVHRYEPGAKGKSVGVVAEPLVRNFLERMAHEPDAYARCDKYIASDIRRASGTSYGNIAELAIANRVIHARGQPLRELLCAWGLEPPQADFLDGMTVLARAAASIDDLPSRDPTDFMFAPLWHVTMPRDGVVMPDVSFFASNQHKDYCLVTIQSKVTATKLSGSKFDGAIRSTSTSHSIRGPTLHHLLTLHFPVPGIHKLFTARRSKKPTCTPSSPL